MAPPRIPRPLLLAAAVLALTLAPSASAETAGDVLGLSVERVEHFREALRRFFWAEDAPSGSDVLALESRWDAPPRGAATGAWTDDEPLPLDGRDRVADEQLMTQGREGEYRRAAWDWVEDEVKGTAPPPSHRLGRVPAGARVSWDGGPWAGLRVGGLSLDGGASGWRVRWRQRVPLTSGDGWSLRVSVGQDDGEGVARFTLGRSLSQARR